MELQKIIIRTKLVTGNKAYPYISSPKGVPEFSIIQLLYLQLVVKAKSIKNTVLGLNRRDRNNSDR
jgi:hypothetical protein